MIGQQAHVAQLRHRVMFQAQPDSPPVTGNLDARIDSIMQEEGLPGCAGYVQAARRLMSSEAAAGLQVRGLHSQQRHACFCQAQASA